MHVNTDRELSSDIWCAYQNSRRRINYKVLTRCIHKIRLGMTIQKNNSESSSVEESVRSKKKKVTNNTSHYKNNDTRISVARNLKRIIERKSLIKEGPHFICVIYHLHKNSVKKFSMNNTSWLVNHLLHLQEPCDECFYICKTCHSKVRKNRFPC